MILDITIYPIDYLQLMLHGLFLSLQIIAIYFSFFPGNIFGKINQHVANWLDWCVGSKASKYIQKPLWGCLPCMASLWTIIITQEFNLTMILIVSGINVIIESAILSHD